MSFCLTLLVQLPQGGMLYSLVHLKYLDQYSTPGRISRNVLEFNRNDISSNESK